MAFIRDQIIAISRKVMLYLSVSSFDAAEKLLKSTLHDHGPLANLLNLLGLTYHKQSRFNEAVVEYKKAIRSNIEFIEPTLNLTVTLCDLGRYDEARELYNSLSIDTNSERRLPKLCLGRIANLHADTGKSYEQAGLFQDAIQEYRKAIYLYPKLPDIKLSLAKLYLKTNLFDKAQHELEELSRIDPTLTEPYTLLGLVFYKRGNKSLAKEFWAKAQNSDSTDVTSRTYLRMLGG